MINCSQAKFVAIILDLSFFRLTDFASDPFIFSSSKTGSTDGAQRALSALFKEFLETMDLKRKLFRENLLIADKRRLKKLS